MYALIVASYKTAVDDSKYVLQIVQRSVCCAEDIDEKCFQPKYDTAHDERTPLTWLKGGLKVPLSPFKPPLNHLKPTLKASAYSFKRFTSRLLKSSFSLSLYVPITSDECHAWFHLNTEQVNITNKILPMVGFEPPTPHGLKITSPKLSPLGYNSLDMRWN